MKTFFVKLARGSISSFVVVAESGQAAIDMVKRHRSFDNIVDEDFAIVCEIINPMILATH